MNKVGFMFFLFAIVILPYALIAAGFYFLIRAAYRSRSSARPLLLYPAISSLIITFCFTSLGHFAIMTSRSSTAAIGYIFLPFYSIGVALAAFLVSWSLLYLARLFILGHEKKSNGLKLLLSSSLAISILSVTGFITWNWVARHTLLNTAAATSIGAVELEAVLDIAISSHDLEVLSKLAKNPKTSTNELIRIYDSCKDRISDFNPLEYTVFYSLAQNPHTPPDKLDVLAKCQQSSIRLAVGMNPSTPMNSLQQLATDNDALVRTWLTSNPKVPMEILVKLADDPDKIVRSYANGNMGRRAIDKASQGQK